MAVSDLNEIGQWRYPDKKFCVEKDILIKQTNVLGNTYFSNYVEWQGEVREKFLLQHPAATEFLKLNPHIMMITYSLFHNFIKHTFFGDRVRIELTSRDIAKNSAFLVFNYFNVRTEEKVGSGWQKICFSDASTNSICAIPQIFLDLLLPVDQTMR